MDHQFDYKLKYIKYKRKSDQLINLLYGGAPRGCRGRETHIIREDRRNPNILITQIVGGFLMSLIGDNMAAIIAMLQPPLVINGTVVPYVDGAEATHFVNVRGAMVYDPYTFHMQPELSHQFCQTHALMLSLIPDGAIGTFVTNEENSYDELLRFWDNHLEVILGNLGPGIIGALLEIIRAGQLGAEKPSRHGVINDTINHMLGLMGTPHELKEYIVGIMDSDESCRYWPHIAPFI